MQDCVYVGGFLNNGTNQYIQATDAGWRIVTPGTVEIQASDINANCDFKTSGDVIAGGISLKGHTQRCAVRRWFYRRASVTLLAVC
ncbi:hypothetical protein PT277_04495 [Acetobacteraceae bacterium ESL0709]|nr:hypothetical protein [Acetobacteraceae bacterium ESL0709]